LKNQLFREIYYKNIYKTMDKEFNYDDLTPDMLYEKEVEEGE